MRRFRKITLWTLGVLATLPILAVAVLLIALNIGPGRLAAELLVNRLAGGAVTIEGLSGRFPDHLHLHRLEVRDAAGPWLSAEDIALDWSPTALLHRQAAIDSLTAARVQVPRLPQPAATPAAPATDGKPFTLPVQVQARRIHIDKIELGAPVAGIAATASLDGSADLASLQSGSADLRLQRLDGGGAYAATARLDPSSISLNLDLAEPEGGLIAHLASLPALGPITLKATLDGPRSAAATTFALAAGPLQANGKGTLDLDGRAADLDVSAAAPAMTPRPDVSWQSIGLQAHVRGPFTRPEATGQLHIDGLQAAGAALRQLTADVQGNAGRVALHAVADGLRLPGAPDLLAAAPMLLDADVRLDDPARPVAFALSHPLLTAKGTAQTGGGLQAAADIAAPDLQPFAALGGIDLQGRTAAHVTAAIAGNTTRIELDGAVSLTGGPAPAPALVGQDAKLGVSAQLDGPDLTLSRLEFAGKAITLSAQGSSRAGTLDAAYKVALADLAIIAPTLSGAVQAEGHVTGKPGALSLVTTLHGDIGAPGVPRGPVTLRAALDGLPGAPTGHVEAEGQLLGAPLALAVDARREADGALHAEIARADWRSLHAEGALTLAPRATLPNGRVHLRMTRLADLDPLIGQPLMGAVTADLRLDAGEAHLDAEARDAGLPAARVRRLAVTARIKDPTARPVIAAQLAADGIEAGTLSGSAKLDLSGPQDALAVRTTASLRAAGADAAITGAAVVNVPGKQVSLSALQAASKSETLRLLAPATLRFGDAVAVDRLRLGLRTAVLEVAGRLSPALDLTATLRAPADLAALAAPDLAADGTIQLDAKLTGTPARPAGTVRLNLAGLRLRTGPGRALPAANVVATADLAGALARIDARVSAGSTIQLAITGQAPLGASPLNLRALGSLDLAVLDPLLTAGGRRARGRVQLDAAITGTPAAARITGGATLANGELQDFGQGVRITDLAATLRADGDTVRITSLQGRAGPGTLSATGTVGVLAPGLPIDLAIILRNARPLASDRLTADLDADLTLRGPATGTLQAAGTILVRRAEIRIPERLPATVAVLDVRRPGQRPPAPTAPGGGIGLDLRIDVPRAVFVRGRGVDAELSGNLRVRGSSIAPQVGGGLEMRRGTISVAGTTLTFTRGKVGFDGTGVTGKIDPTLDFAADSVASTVTATLGITGYASKPVIKLTSTPELPQDEVLAYLLFKRSSKELGPFQLAEIAAAVASLTGVGGSVANPLESVRKGLGLDRLSVGGGSGASSSPSVEAGRYVGNGVYVGAKQGTTGGQTQATVQIDITKGLKLQTDVGTGQGGNQVGVTYQFEY